MQSAAIIGASALLIAILIWRCWRMFRPSPSLLDHAVVFFGLVFSAMLVVRWAGIVFGAELNLDESQMVAQAMRFLSHPVPWRDVDSTTSGPLNSLLLSVPLWCGAPATWETARLALFVANCAVMLFIYFSLRFFLTRQETQFALMPLALFYAFTLSPDYTHYSSETLSSVLLSASFYLLARQWAAGRVAKAEIFLTGLLLGAVPFAKLQAAPPAVFLGVAGLALIFVRRQRAENARSGFRTEMGALLAGSLVVPAIILGVVAAKGAFNDFWISYILSTRKDAATEHVLSSGTLQGMPAFVKRMFYLAYILFSPANLGVFFLSGMGALVILWGIYRARKTPVTSEVRRLVAVIIAYGCFVILCIFTAGKPFAHYGILMITPLALLIGLAFFAGKTVLGLEGQIGSKTGSLRVRWLTAFTILVIIPEVYLGPWRIYQCIASHGAVFVPWVPSVSAIARTASRPGDTLSVWGWMPDAYVRTGLPSATRDAVSHYAVSGPYQEYYRNRYLQDLKRSRPAIFIDSIGDGGFPAYTQWTATQRHENFPELAKFVDDNYALLASVQLRRDVKAGPVRIYVSKKRLAELHLTAANPGAAPTPDYPPTVPQSVPERILWK